MHLLEVETDLVKEASALYYPGPGVLAELILAGLFDFPIELVYKKITIEDSFEIVYI